MAEKIYNWTDDPMVSGVADCNTDVVNDCLMHLKYENTSDAIQNMYETGQVEKQTRGYNQLVEMKRSTFDKSKFTVVGNPTITDDGVASGFVAQSSYIKTALTIDFTSAQSFEIAFSITTPIAPAEQSYTGVLSASDLGNNEYIVAGYELQNNRFIYGVGSPTGTFWNVNSSSSVKPNTKYYIKIKVNNTTVVIQKSTDNINWETDASGSLNTSLNLNSSLFFGVDRGKIRPFKGSIDLKAFSITVDGKEVFNGNKTGINTIKTDNYEVVGSPVISDDGVASGWSKENHITIPDLKLQNAKTWKIEGVVDIKSAQTEGAPCWLSVTQGNGLMLPIWSDSTYARFQLYLSSSASAWDIVNTESPNVLLSEGSTFKCELEFTGTQYVYTIYQVATGRKVAVLTADSSDKVYQSPTVLGIKRNTHPMASDNTIDLNAFKIYVDGKLVYQPCLKIPYTQSKTGSKIADGVYRDRVQDVYEQFGTASYYTIDETNQNFTLPMGEIYGMIEDNASKINGIGDSKVDKSTLAEIYPVVKTYINGASWYRVYSDNWCEQGGIATISGNQTLSISLMKAYTNTTYSILQSMYTTNHQDVWGYGNKVAAVTTSSFSLYNNSATSGNICWRTSGYIGGSNEGIQ